MHRGRQQRDLLLGGVQVSHTKASVSSPQQFLMMTTNGKKFLKFEMYVPHYMVQGVSIGFTDVLIAYRGFRDLYISGPR